jgi:hypothetical protein
VTLYLTLFRSISRSTTLGSAAQVVLIASLASASINDFLLPTPWSGSYMGLLFCLAGIALGDQHATAESTFLPDG